MRSIRWLISLVAMKFFGMAAICILALAAFGTAATAELIDNANGTITDTATGLMWLKNANMNGAMTHDQATSWAQNLTFAGLSGWRLPSGQNRNGTGPVCDSRPSGANCRNTEFATLYFDQLVIYGHPGPFQNLQAGSYWTSTDAPGNPSQAMAQDFIDGGQLSWNKSNTLFAWAVRDTGITPIPTALYGIVQQDPNRGALITIDTSTAAVTIVGNTTLTQPCGLAFNRIAGRLYANECVGQAGIHVVDLSTAAASPLGSPGTGARPIAHRHIDNFIYGVDASPALLRIDPTTGEIVRIVGMVAKQSVGGIAARLTDGQLFGVGFANLGSNQKLFRLTTAEGSGPRDTDVAAMPGATLRALTFHYDGNLYATDGTNLLVVNPTTGTITSSRAFSGAPIGAVGGLAGVGPTVQAPPDVWLRDCAADTGGVPSAPTPCSQWWRSPDIAVDHPVVVGRTNVVRVSVRNRGIGPAANTVVRLVHFSVLSPSSLLGSGGVPTDATLVGQRAVSVSHVAPHNVVNIPFTWTPSSVATGRFRCLGVILDHPLDRPRAVLPPRENNIGVSCTKVGG